VQSLDGEIEQISGLFPGWRMELIQLAPRCDTSAVSWVAFRSQRILRLHAGSALAIRGSVPTRSSCVLFSASQPANVRFLGQPLTPNRLVRAGAGAHVDLFVPNGADLLMLVVESRRSMPACGVLLYEDGNPTPQGLDDVRVSAVVSACRLVDKRFPVPVTLTELSRHCGVAQRTLEYAFRHVYDTTPLAFIRSQRLTRNRMALLGARANNSISDTARACGFTHMGQYCKDYRRLFGETPSMTLARGRMINECAAGSKGLANSHKAPRTSVR
jgi:AraC-like DNA-binding protein